jgi:hypothetical protein
MRRAVSASVGHVVPQAPGRAPRERCPGAEDLPRDASEAPASEAVT